ncbi:MAG: glycoside hydrolase family 30 beta sandwich domain-containing protein [Acholeplasma sp.]|jgi:glucosylceramidase|nr:glycoside hydrolase family 30 beta sandwich domain-containing protein [Acholeplasma sp.]
MNKTVKLYVTTGDESKKFVQEPVYSTTNKPNIHLNPNHLKQVVDGFGAAMTESSAFLLSQLDSKHQHEVMTALFGKEGIGISFVRTTIGASDFSMRSYTYHDIDPQSEDDELNQFSLSDDLNYVIPMLKVAKTYHDFLVVSSPWTAPAWMKDNHHLNGGRLLPKHYGVYSRYLAKFIKSYQAIGIDIYAITPQNEPRHEALTYPSMLMSGQEQKVFVQTLADTFKAENIQTKIIAYDHNWDDIDYVRTIYSDEKAVLAVAGTGFHCYDGNVKATQALIEEYPDKDIWFTECSGGLWANNFSDNLGWNLENVFLGSLQYGAKSVLLWNIALDLECGPKNGGCMNCRGLLTIDPITQNIEKNVEYYLVGHFSKFVQRGAHVIETVVEDTDLIGVSFLNPDQSMVCVVYNKSDEPKEIRFAVKDAVLGYQLKEKSVLTFVL